MRERFLRLAERGRDVPGFAPSARATPAYPRDAREDVATLPRDLEVCPRDWAVFLLHAATEIEHALLVQYLYAAYSIRPGVPIPKDPNGLTTDVWRFQILSIAKEEMGHLLTLQNILHVLGGPLNFERQDFPHRSSLYPFPFTLQPFTKDSLAKYVAAEMPVLVDPSVLSQKERDEIWTRATGSAGGEPVNHVGTLYRSLIDQVADLPDGDFRTDRGDLQGTLQEGWGDNDTEDPHGVKVIAITGRDAAANKLAVLRALRIIALQGEGASAASVSGSHFKRFLDIYRQLPAMGFDPSFPVGTNPYIAGGSLAGPGDPIVNPATQLWARLFNVRYRILLTELAHVLDIPPTDGAGKPTPRAKVIEWVFNEMAFAPASIQQLAIRLAEMPRDKAGGPTAGATFGLPYTMQLPTRGPERWRLHLDLIDASVGIIRAIADPPTDPTLVSIYEFDVGRDGKSGRRPMVVGLLNSPH